MSDNQNWQAPGAPPPPPAATVSVPPPSPSAVRDSASSPIASAPLAAAPGTSRTGWTPPPRAGLVPLRPMSLGVVLSGSFRVLRRNPRTTLGPALLVSVVTTAMATIGSWFVNTWAVSRLTTATYSDDFATEFFGVIAVGALANMLPAAVSLTANAVLQGMVVLTVSRGLLGERIGFAGIRRRIRGRVGALVGWAALAFAAAMTGMAALLLVVVGLGSLGSGGLAAGIALGILLGLGFVVVAILLSVKLAFVSPMLVLERARLGAAISRSWAITRGFFWRLFGIQLLVAVMIAVATTVILWPVSFVVFLVVTLTLPNGADFASFEAVTTGTLVLSGALSAFAGAFGLVLQTSTTALLYFDTRMRVEGLDLQLSRYVEERQRDASTPDPFPAPAAPGVT